MFPVTRARPVPITLTATVRSSEGHSDRGRGSPLKLFVKILLLKERGVPVSQYHRVSLASKKGTGKGDDASCWHS